jgi:trimethylamine---corrinoid protein Co-methyltransferase
LHGFEVSDEHLAIDVISKVGPGGHFLQQRHTMNHFRNELWRSKIFTRQAMENWREAGSKNVEARVREEVRCFLETHQPPSLSEGILVEMDRIKTEGEKALVTR